jgi:hypothetical protein
LTQNAQQKPSSPFLVQNPKTRIKKGLKRLRAFKMTAALLPEEFHSFSLL